MEQKSHVISKKVIKEWRSLGESARGIGEKGGGFHVYHPANATIPPNVGVSEEICEAITLDVNSIESESLSGLLQNVTDTDDSNLPNIFRYWRHHGEEILLLTFQDISAK